MTLELALRQCTIMTTWIFWDVVAETENSLLIYLFYSDLELPGIFTISETSDFLTISGWVD